MQKYTYQQKIAISGLAIALYIVVMICTQSFAFGQYQIRIATALYGLNAIFPFLVVPLGIANMLSNTIMGGLGPLDMIGGGCVGIITGIIIVLGKRYGLGNWVSALAVTLVPGLGVPVWLSIILDLPYWLLVSSVIVGQAISGICSMLMVSALERAGAGRLDVLFGGKKK